MDGIYCFLLEFCTKELGKCINSECTSLLHLYHNLHNVGMYLSLGMDSLNRLHEYYIVVSILCNKQNSLQAEHGQPTL